MSERDAIGLESFGLKLRATSLLGKLRALSYELHTMQSVGCVDSEDDDHAKSKTIGIDREKKSKIAQKGMNIVRKAYRFASQLPAKEQFGISMQIAKAANTIPSTFAEGCSKVNCLESKRYFEVALGSAYELENQLLIAKALHFGDHQLRKVLLKDVDEVQKMLESLIHRVVN